MTTTIAYTHLVEPFFCFVFWFLSLKVVTTTTTTVQWPLFFGILKNKIWPSPSTLNQTDHIQLPSFLPFDDLWPSIQSLFDSICTCAPYGFFFFFKLIWFLLVVLVGWLFWNVPTTTKNWFFFWCFFVLKCTIHPPTKNNTCAAIVC